MKARILVVDDNPVNLKLVSDILECEGYQIVRANDAESGIEIIKTGLPDLILMDIALPGMDGLTFTRQLKAAPETSDIPIIALTAFAMKGDYQKAIDAGCNGYISKPIDTRKLPSQIEEVLMNSARSKKSESIKILVIEDEPASLKLAQAVLASDGNEVSQAKNADQAIEAIKKDRPQVILLDLSLPGMDGLAVARLLKSDPETQDIAIIAVTAFPDQWSKQETVDAGCDALIIKPINTRILAKQVADVIAQKSRED